MNLVPYNIHIEEKINKNMLLNPHISLHFEGY
jgi:hypothetical protein